MRKDSDVSLGPTTTESSKQDQVIKRLKNGQEALRALRWRTAGVLLALGSISALLVDVPLRDTMKDFNEHRNCIFSLKDYVTGLLVGLFWYGRFSFLALAPLADDKWSTRAIIILESMLLVYGLKMILDEIQVMVHSFENYVVAVGLTTFFLLGGLFAMLAGTASEMQRRFWWSISIWMCLGFLSNVVLSLQRALECRTLVPQFMLAVGMVLVLPWTLHERTRRALQAWISNILELRSERKVAAGIAGLVGNWSAAAALAEAHSRFRTISLDRLQFHHVSDSSSDPTLASLCSPARLLECDAFVSHSWHDNAAMKWKALQTWRSNFVQDHGREPRVWFDKCCIDQTDIASDLRCLPIFLAGSKTLLVLCGATYLQRLWCIVEIFTFVHMGRGVDKIEFVPVYDPDSGESTCIDDCYRHFDSELCKCTCEEDKAKMLEIINAAFGSLASFNEYVRDIFTNGDWISCVSTSESRSSLPSLISSGDARVETSNDSASELA